MIGLVDTHQHLVYPDRFNYPWIGDVPKLQKSFTIEDYTELTQGHGIEAALFMEVDVVPEDSADEARYFAARAEEDNVLVGVIASGRPEHAGFEAYLDSIAGPRLKALRRVLHVVDDSVSQSTLFRENIRLLGKRHLPFDICALPHQHELMMELIDACPDTTFVLDHCGNPDISKPDTMAGWLKTLKELAERPNLNAKLSGIVVNGREGAVTGDDIKPYLDAMLDTFGVDRLVWGSDWPVCTLTTPLTDWITLFRDWAEPLSEDEKLKLFAANAKRIYQI